eukprot:RCo033173
MSQIRAGVDPSSDSSDCDASYHFGEEGGGRGSPAAEGGGPARGHSPDKELLKEELRRRDADLCRSAELGQQLVQRIRELEEDLREAELLRERAREELSHEVERLSREKAEILGRLTRLARSEERRVGKRVDLGGR